MRREAAVLVPVYRRQDGELMVVLIRRAQGGAHGGQLALPGGQRDPADADLAATALREANEELGLTADHVELLAALPVVETRTTGFRVAPFLARVTGPVPWRLQEREVAEVVELAVAELARPGVRVEEVRAFPTWLAPRRIRLWRVGRHEVWGVTSGSWSPWSRGCWVVNDGCDGHRRRLWSWPASAEACSWPACGKAYRPKGE
jgi:8-oxo-dGTP pyrophosphatase MutT (NUDIX family)